MPGTVFFPFQDKKILFVPKFVKPFGARAKCSQEWQSESTQADLLALPSARTLAPCPLPSPPSFSPTSPGLSGAQGRQWSGSTSGFSRGQASEQPRGRERPLPAARPAALASLGCRQSGAEQARVAITTEVLAPC